MIAALVILAAVVSGVVLLHAMTWAAQFGLIWVSLTALVWLVGLRLYHARRMAEIHEREIRLGGQFRRAGKAIRWPKICRQCGATLSDLHALEAHCDPARSACAAHLEAVDAAAAAELAAPVEFTATVVGKGGAPAVDTMLDEPGKREQIES
jgi:hypothetical protein